MAVNQNNIYTLQATLKSVVDDMELRAKTVLEKYAGKIPDLPTYEDVKKKSIFYATYDGLVRIQQELVDIMTRLDLVIIQMEDIRKVKLTRDLSNDFRELTNFRNWVDSVVDKFKTYRYDLIENKRVVSDRVKLLQALVYSSDSKNI